MQDETNRNQAMPWDCLYHPDTAIIDIRYSGNLSPGDLAASVTRALEVAMENGTNRVLGDCTLMEGGHSVIDLYALAEVVSGKIRGPLREAVIPPAQQPVAEMVRFWETTTGNRGLVQRTHARIESIRSAGYTISMRKAQTEVTAQKTRTSTSTVEGMARSWMGCRHDEPPTGSEREPVVNG